MTNITEVRNTSSALHLLNTELWSSMVELKQRGGRGWFCFKVFVSISKLENGDLSFLSLLPF